MNPTPSSSHSGGYGYTDSATTSTSSGQMPSASGYSGTGYSSSAGVGGVGAGLGYGGAIPPSPFSYYSSAYIQGGMNPPSPYLNSSFGQYAAMAMMNRGHHGQMPLMYPSHPAMGMGAPTYLPLMSASYNHAYPYGYGANPFAPAPTPYMWPPPMSMMSLMGNAYPPPPTMSSYHQEFRAIAPATATTATSGGSGSSASDIRSHSEDAGFGSTRAVQQSRPQSAEELVNSQILLDSIIRNDNSRSTSRGRGTNGHESGQLTNDEVHEVDVDVTTAEEEDDFSISQYHQRQLAVTQRDGQPLRRSPRRRQTVLPTPTVQEAPQRKRRYVRRNKPRRSNKGNAAKKACPEIPLDRCSSSAATSAPTSNSQASSSRPLSQPKANRAKASDRNCGKNVPDTDVSIFVREDVSEQTSRLWNVPAPASGPASEVQTTASTSTSSVESFPTEQERKKHSALPVPLVLLKNLKNHITPEKPSPRAPLSFSDRKFKMGYTEEGRDLIDIIEKEHLKQIRTPVTDVAAAAQLNIQQNSQQANPLIPKISSRSSSPQAVGLHGLFSRDLDPPEKMFDIANHNCRPLYLNAPNRVNKIPEEDPSTGLKAEPKDKRPRKGRPAKKRNEFIKD